MADLPVRRTRRRAKFCLIFLRGLCLVKDILSLFCWMSLGQIPERPAMGPIFIWGLWLGESN